MGSVKYDRESQGQAIKPRRLCPLKGLNNVPVEVSAVAADEVDFAVDGVDSVVDALNAIRTDDKCLKIKQGSIPRCEDWYFISGNVISFAYSEK